MDEPDYCEAQLQQMVNTELFNRLRLASNPAPIPIVVPQWLEDLWGWDTGIYLPWLGPGNAAQKGCNFFIQYKLSKRYKSKGAYGWEKWNKPFFRFNLGYQRDGQWDLSQRDHLVMLAADGFIVAHVTNHVLTLKDLTELAAKDLLCDKLPVLRTTQELSKHRQVSFLPSGKDFALHSQSAQAHVVSLLSIFDEGRATQLTDDLPKLARVLKHFEEAVGITEHTLARFLEHNQVQRIEQKALVAAAYLRKYLNVIWLRGPGKEKAG